MSPSHISILAKQTQTSIVIVVLGAGGVGKTTTSIALALLGAHLGKRVGLLSIDPAKRLADAMGLRFGSDLHPVDLPSTAELSFPGSLHAAMLDQKSVFDAMVTQFAPGERARESIFANRLYQQVSTNLGGPLEYVAIAKLQTMLASQAFDLIVLDTPPDTHALDFLVRPNMLAGFMDSKVMSWLIKPFYFAKRLGMGQLLSVGERLMGGLASVTGVKALQTLAEFLVLMEDVITGFHRSGEAVKATLRSDATSFSLVTAPRTSSVRSAVNLVRELHEQGFVLASLIVNRYPSPPEDQTALAKDEVPRERFSFKNGRDILARQKQSAEEAVATLMREAATILGMDLPLIRLEEREAMIHSLSDLCELVVAMTKVAQSSA